MTPLKRIFFVASAFLACIAVFHFFTGFLQPSEAVAKIRVKGLSRAIPFSGEILSQPLLQKALISLEPSGLSQDALRKKVSHLRQSVTVSRGETSEILIIRYVHRDFSRAARVVNAIAVSFRDFYSGLASAELSSLAAKLDREILVLEKEIFELETRLQKLKKESEPDDVDIQLALNYKALEARYRELNKTFTRQYPEIIELEKEMSSVEAQIMDASFHDPAHIEKTRLALLESESAYRKLRSERETLKLKSMEVEDNIKILALSEHSVPSNSFKAHTFLPLVGVLPLVFVIFWPFRKS